MKLARVLGIAAFVVAVGFFSGAAYADSIGPDCGSCFGGIFSLSYIPPDDGHVTIIYKADLSNSTITDIDVIGFKVVSGGNTNNRWAVCTREAQEMYTPGPSISITQGLYLQA